MVGSARGLESHGDAGADGAHRSLVDSGIPAVRLEVGLLEHVAALRRMEGRYAILKDPAFLGIFRGRLRAAAGDLDRLEGLLATPPSATSCGDPDLPRRVPPARGAGVRSRPATLIRRWSSRTCSTGSTWPPWPSSGVARRASRRIAERTRVLGITALGAAVLIGLALGGFAVLRVAGPLHRLRTATQAVAAREFSEP